MRRLNYKADLSALLISGLILAGFGWIFSRQQLVLDNKVKNQDQSSENVKESAKEEKSVNPDFLYVVKKKNEIKQIVKISLLNNQEEVIYTDSDERAKLISAVGLASGKMIILESENKLSETGNLTLVSTDKKAQKEIKQKDYYFNSNPVYDEINNQLILVDFSQAEKDFGFMVNSVGLDGSNSRNIVKNVSNISALSISDNNKIVFTQLVDKNSRLSTYDLNGNKLKEIDINGIIIDTAWGEDKIIASVAPIGNATANQSEINIFSPELVTNENKVIKHEGAEINMVSIDKELVAYLNVNYKNGMVTKDVEGDIILSNIATGEEKNIGRAIQIIGYNNE